MGFTDTVTKSYIRENTVFADAFNYLLYDGKQIIKPENLHTKDITEIAIPFHPEDKTFKKCYPKVPGYFQINCCHE